MNGYILKLNDGYDVNLRWVGYGKMNLMEILQSENAWDKMQTLNEGDMMVFTDSEYIIE